MAKIKNERPLTYERLREVLEYDPVSGIFRWRECLSNIASIGSIAGAVRKRGYRIICVDRNQYKASRLAWFYVHGSWPIGYLDHANGIRSDDRFLNLREATPTDNSANRIGTGRSGVKGVSISGSCYRAFIMRQGKMVTIGCFSTLEEASAARKEAALKMHGHFALEARL